MQGVIRMSDQNEHKFADENAYMKKLLRVEEAKVVVMDRTSGLMVSPSPVGEKGEGMYV